MTWDFLWQNRDYMNELWKQEFQFCEVFQNQSNRNIID